VGEPHHGEDERIAGRLDRGQAFALAQDDSSDTQAAGVPQGIAEQSVCLDAGTAVGRQVVRLVKVKILDVGGRHERANVEGLRNPLRSYFADLIETKVLTGPNPAADLKHFIGKGANKRARNIDRKYFGQEEGPQLVATARALCPRWSTFILTGMLAGLRWGESAALRRSDIDWQRGRLHVTRTVSDKGRHIEACKGW
jgi:integrase